MPNPNALSPRRTRKSAPSGRRVRRPDGRRRPSVENLEVRALLSTMYVDDDWATAQAGQVVGEGLTFGTNAFATIPAAIAKATDGGEVRIAEGSYAISSAINIGKSVDLIGAGAALTKLNVSGSSAIALDVRAADVSLSGFTLTGPGTGAAVRYGINVGGRSGVSISDVVVTAFSRSGVNLNGASNATIADVTSFDNGGAGFFFTDVKTMTLTDVQTSGNAWTGVAFSTYGRDYAVGVQGVVIAGDSRFGEVASANGGVMLEEGRWDSVARALDTANPVPITFSTDPADGADVTFTQDASLAYALSGPQDDGWPVRRRFYETLDQGLAAAAGSPDHFLAAGRVLASAGSQSDPRDFVVAPGMSIQAAIEAASAGDSVGVRPGTYAENLMIDAAIVLEGLDEGVVLSPAAGDALTIRGVGSESSPTTVRGLKIAGGDRGVVFDAAAGHVLLSGLEIAGTGVGVAATDSAVVSSLTIERSTVSGNGVGLLASPSSSIVGLTVSGSAFDDNDGYGFQVLADPSSSDNQARFSQATFSGTTFDRNGWGGLRAEKLDRASFSGVAARDNGGTGLDFDLLGGSYSDLAIDGSTFTGNEGWAIAVRTTDAFAAGVSVRSSVISANDDGLLIGEGVSGVVANWNRIIGPGRGLENQSGAAVSAAYNWWGSNEGPGNAAVGLVDATPYIVLRLSAPGSLPVGGSASVTADLNHDSLGDDVSSLGTIPGVTTIVFATSLGLVDPSSATVAAGVAAASFSAGVVPGPATLSATVDGVTAFATIQVQAPPLSIAGPSTVAQGSPYILTLTAGAEAGAVSLWTIDWGDGTTEDFTGPISSASHVYPAGPASYTIRAWATTPIGFYEVQGATTVAVLNVAPTVAITTGPSSVGQGASAVFAAAGSDPGGAVSYAWTAIKGLTVVAMGSGPAFSFAPTTPGEYTVIVTASDGQGGLTAATSVLNVLNVAPTVAIASGPSAVGQGVAAEFVAAGSDPGGAVEYAWTASVGGVVVATGSGAAFSFAPTTPGEYAVVVSATDAHGGSTVATTSLLVQNVAPTVAITAGPSSAGQGETAEFSAVGSDPGGKVEYAWTASVAGVVVATGSGPAFAFVPTAPGEYAVTVTATDAHGATSSASAALTVPEVQDVPNVAPTVTILPLPGPAELGAKVTLAAVATDPNPASPPTFAWIVRRGGVEVARGDGPSLAFTPVLSGLYEAVVEVSDGEGGVASASVQFTVDPPPFVGPLPPAVERVVEAQVARTVVQVERQVRQQDERLQVLYERYGESPPPTVQRMIQRVVQAKARIEAMAARRIIAIHRTFSLMGRRRG